MNDLSTPFILWWVATLGNTLGGMTNWLLGFWLSNKSKAPSIEKPSSQKALKQIRHFGAPVLLLSWLPFIGDPLCLVAGWSRISPWQAILYIAIGKGLRYLAILWAIAG